MQKQIQYIVIGLAAALGSSFAVADSASLSASNTASTAEHGNVSPASREAAEARFSGGWRFVGGEAVWILETGAGIHEKGKTRAEVLKELAEFQRNPEAQLRHQSLYQGGS